MAATFYQKEKGANRNGLFFVGNNQVLMLNLLYTFTTGNTFFLAFLVLTIRRDTNVLGNRWLAIFLGFLGIFLVDQCLFFFKLYDAYPTLIGVLSFPVFAVAPSMYMAVSYFVTLDKRFQRRDIWHFLPAILTTLLSIPGLFTLNDAQKLELVTKVEFADLVVLCLIIGQLVIYWILAYRKLVKHRKNVENISSSPETINLDWLRYTLWAIAVMLVTWIGELTWSPLNEMNATYSTPLYFAAVCFLGYHALRQREIFPFPQQSSLEITEILAENDAPDNLSRRKIFSEHQLKSLGDQLSQHMATQRPYLNNELTLPELARQLNLSTHELSHLINEGFGENFSQFVNRYRVEESKVLLRSEKHVHLNMVGIAYEAGFNSKTAFNTTFKKMTGVSPSEFREKVATG